MLPDGSRNICVTYLYDISAHVFSGLHLYYANPAPHPVIAGYDLDFLFDLSDLYRDLSELCDLYLYRDLSELCDLYLDLDRDLWDLDRDLYDLSDLDRDLSDLSDVLSM